ncbi:Ig-like domain-containing protein [Nostoc sp. MS1]|uniref:Ig-like domain-containing protein n=1 Tax=Nostoc sp. MS1 TaxID=2764711 RepID=UPI001CC55878|nr:Ig-like domain-containing protein [Nostoc sp. MS1]BCL35091.1 hypothetical protein NSMS1_15380 [Nostoc sp. MS1]
MSTSCILERCIVEDLQNNDQTSTLSDLHSVYMQTDSITPKPNYNRIALNTSAIPLIEDGFLAGDANNDGGLSNLDVDIILKDRDKPIVGVNDPRDFNGDGKITIVDVRSLGLSITGNKDKTPPILSASLANDTNQNGGTNTDKITADPTIKGSVTDASRITRIQAGLNNTNINKYTNIRGVIAADGSFTLTPEQLTQINNNIPLAQGQHTLHLIAKDQWNNTTTFDLTFTLDSNSPTITAALTNDTGSSANDKITKDAAITGSINDLNQIVSFKAGFDNTLTSNFVDVLGSLQGNTFTFEQNKIKEINGGDLSNGSHTLKLIATDIAGNTANFEYSFTLDALSPQRPGLMLDSLFDSAPIGDSQTTFATVDLIGQTEANATVILQGTGKSITADGTGKYKFTGVELQLGDNSFTAIATDKAGNTSTFTEIVKRVNTDNGDVVLDWNAILLNAIYTDKTAPPVATRNMAIAQTAVFDAINSITKTYKNYYFSGTAPLGASAEAAAAAAAHRVLINLYPGQISYFDTALVASLAKITDGAAEDAGVTFGRTVADSILSLRSTDGANNTVTYTPGTNPGDWQPTAPGFAPALLPQWGQVTPFALTSGDQFRPNGQPALNSQQYTDDYNQVKELGKKDSTTRTAEQTEIALFWANGTGTFTPPGHWNQIAQNVVANKGNSLIDNARLFALLDVSIADAGIAAWDAKYHYNFWRPITAIQKGDTDGNPNTTADPNWTPLLTTPPFPDYISGHSTFSGAAATVLTSLLGDNVSFRVNSLGLPGVYRQFNSFTAAADEAGISRVYGGIHFNTANVDGIATGKSIGNYVLQNLLAPVSDTQPPVIGVTLANDSGSNGSDRITSDPNIKGTLSDTSQIVKLTAKLNSGNFVDVLSKLNPNGSFTLDKATLTQINGGQLPDGTYQLSLQAEDKFGNASETKLEFTLDSSKPVAPTELKIKDDTDTVTKNNKPTIIGKAETGSLVQIFDGQTKIGQTTAVNGTWEITPSQLSDGVKNLTVNAIDVAGNVSENASLQITVDTIAPQINLTTPQANAQLTAGAKLQGSLDGTGSTISKLTYRFNNGNEVEVPVNTQGQFNADLNLTGLSGQQNLIITSVDLAGNTTQTSIPVTISIVNSDTTPPTVTISSTASTAVSYIELTFNEAITDSSFAADKYSLKIAGGTQDGQTVPISSVQKLSSTLVRLNLAAAFTSGNYKLTIASGITDLAGNATTAAQVFDINVAAAPVIISPSDGEAMVGLNRETIVRFGKKVDPTTVNSEDFYLIANGRRIEGEIKVSSTEEFATFFYKNPLPSSTEVRVFVDGSKIIGRDGVAIDGDGDGQAGGIATADFTTLPITRIKGTDVWGYVYDSYNKNPDGSNIPIKGVTIRLDALPDVFAVTDEKGYFILKDVPAPEFFVYIDGSTATGAPEASQYASLGKPFHSVPGQSTQLFMDGVPFNVYLPPMAKSDIQQLSTTEDTKVGFGETAQAFLEKQFPNVDPELWKEVKVTFNPGSAQDDQGNRATQATIIPVDPQRLPAPLPPGVDPKLVISIQAGGANGFNREADGGATNFDVPAPIQFPNLDGLRPGEKSLFWSFDHDAGKWIVIGTGTVSEDGKTVVSDPGVGVLAPGWHFTQPGTPNSPPPPPPPPPPGCKPNPAKVECLKVALENYAVCLATWGLLGTILTGVPGGLVGIIACTAQFTLDVHRCDKLPNCLPNTSAARSLNPFVNALSDSLTGDAKGDKIAAIGSQIVNLLSPYALDGQTTIPLDVQAQIEQLAAQANDIAGGDAIAYMRNLVLQSELANAGIEESYGNAPSYGVLYAAQIQGANGETFVVRGQTTADGQYTIIVPRNGTIQFVSFYDPLTNSYGVVTPRLDPSATYQLPRLTLVQVDENFADSDKDGLVDVVEFVYGTSSNKSDTDKDGINDFAEIKQGLDPLNGRGFPTGIISSLPLQGEAKAVVVEGSVTNAETQTAYIATGSYGLAIVNASQFNNPVVLGQLNLSGDATDVAVDAKLNIAAVATNSGGLQLVDVSDGMVPTLRQTLNLAVNQVEVADGIAYATVNNVLYAVDLATGEQLQSFTLPGNGTVTGLAREGTKLYAFVSGSDTFSVIDITSEGSAAVVGQLNVNVASSDVGLFVGNGVAYLAGSGLRTINVSNPSSPTLISDADQFFTARGLTLNGSGLALVAAEGQGLAVYSSTDPQDTDAFLTVFDTPGFAYDAAVASGIAFVADGNSGLQVINYLGFDNKGQAPTITLNTTAIDLDPNTPGIQVQEGSTIPLRANVSDDVQVRNVELLVNGQVVSNDVSFPWDLSVIAPKITADVKTVDLQVRATDTGGNIALSNVLTLNLSEDKFAPKVLGTTPSEDSRRKEIPSIAVRFDEAIDTTKLNLSGITLTNLGKDGVLGGGDDVVTSVSSLLTRSFDRTLVISPGNELSVGNYQLKIDPSIIADRAGNALTSPFTLEFTKRPLTTPLTLGTTITSSLVEPGDNEVYTFTGTPGQRILFDNLNNSSTSIYAQLQSPSGISLGNYFYYGNDSQPFTLTETGTYRVTIQSTNNATGNYSFRLLDASAAPTITLGTTVTNTLNPGLETDVYRINGTAGQRLFFDSLATASGASWYLYNSGNQYITGSSLSSDFETTLTNTGTYLLVLDGNNSNGNTNYSFKVTNPPTTTTALTLSNTVTSTISQPGETDEYTFTGTAGQRLYYDGLINNNTSTIYAQLISPSGQQVFYNGDADSDRAPFTLTETGTYRLIIDGYLDNTGDYSFRLVDASAAPTITLDSTISNNLTPGLEADVYRINGTAGQRLFFNSLANATNGSWYLYGVNNQYITAASLSSDFETTLTNTGTYLLVLDGNNSNGNTNYSFKVTNPPTTTTALTLSNTVTSTISQPGETDEYTFTGTAGQRLYYDGLINNNTSTIYAQLISPSGQQVFYNGDADSDRAPFTLTETGAYRLIIDGYLDNTGDYSFRLVDASAAPTITLDNTISNTLTPGLEADVYRINGTAGQRLFFNSLANATNGSWYLYGVNNQYIAGSNLSTDFEVTLTNTGTYLLVLDGNNSNGNTNYSFKVTNSGLNSTTALTLGNTITSTISQPGETDEYTFTGTAGQRLYYDALINNNASTIYAQLISPSGQQIFYVDADSDLTPFTLTETGTYKLIIDGYFDNTGDYSFRLVDAGATSAITLGTTITNILNPGLKTDIYRINGTAGQKLRFDALTSGFVSGNWTIYGTGNQYVAATNLGNDFEVTLQNSGTYLLVLDGYNNSGTVNYSFTVTDISDAPVAASGFNSIKTGTIAAGGQDTYTFTASAGLLVYFDGQSANNNIIAELRDTNGQYLTASATNSDTQLIRVPKSGTYTLAVKGANASSTGSYRFQVLDIAAAATDISFNTPATRSLTNGAETVVYRFTGTPGQTLYYDALQSDADTVNAQLVSPSSNIFEINSDSDRNIFTLTEGGTYYLLLKGHNASAADFSFRLINASAATAVTLDTTVADTLTPGLATNIYRINGTAGQKLFFDSLINSFVSANWTLYGPGNQYVTGTNLSSDFETTLTNTGTYLLVIDGYNSNNNPINYSFKVTNPPTTTTALTIGNTVTSTISQVGETDEYTFTGTAGQRLYYDALINNNASTIYAQLISPSGQQVFYNGDADSDRTPFTLTETGTYRLILDGNGNSTGDYSFRLLDASAATAITFDTSITNTLTPGLETDIYRINGTAGQKLFFNSLISSFVSATWTLYSPSNQYVTNANLSSDFETTLTNTGTYLLVIDGYNSNNSPINYNFQVTNPPTTTTALTIGNTVTSTISQVGETDEYTFTGTAGQRLYYDALINNNASTIYAQLISPSGQQVFYNGDADSDRTPFTLTETGTYRLVIDGYFDNTGDYSFRLIDASAVTPVTLDTTITNTLTPGLATNIYRINGTAGQKLFFDSLINSFVSANWTLYSPGNQYVTGANLSSDFEITLTNTGTYLLVIDGYNSNNNPINYSFKVTNPPTTTTALTIGNTVTSTISQVGETDEYTFTGTAGQRLYYDGLINNNTFTIYAQLISPSGQQVFYNGDADSDRTPFTLTETGTYRLILDGNGNSTGDYSFRLIDASAAPSVTLDQTITNTLNPGLETDIYRINGTAGQQLSFDSLIGSFVNANWTLYNQGNQFITNRNLGNDFVITLTNDGTYLLVLDGYLPNGTINYRFQVSNA